MTIRSSTGVTMLTLVSDDLKVANAVQQFVPEANYVSQSRMGERIAAAIRTDFMHFIMLAVIAVIVLVTVLFRNPRKILAALAPVITGLVFMFGMMALLGLKMNMVNVVAPILIIGLAVDYGIFMVHESQHEESSSTATAVWVSALTTIMGFGALVIAQHPAMRSIGTSVLLGITAAIITALVVVPAICGKKADSIQDPSDS
ncbi:MAG: MMPL family transporter [Planctomycetes bacterium]|nr:MMPL family transporter [Planctomycetota bacterium]